MKSIRHIINISILIFASALTASAIDADQYDLPAVGGYDLVSYHQESGPIRGTGFQAAQHEGVTYLFANEANKAAFEANPEKYLPAYNGYCAYGLALGKKFNSNPTVYEFIDGTLYLNLDGDIQKEWAKDIQGNIRKANANWKSIR
ncbi:YHS domain-containing (seleno)protein [Coraliomargarita algicola]|uniref:YHS domain-containing (Seleno)protein n=1 Tax=Coraliomargarita algicola TaxID=3092156 RepID=A0ABZ0RMW9_9BACT|nr:YHS domain-containing (seleno)protein [Coraliomargarita sp. J2-16]WPJ97457.1 YHS domain-containing (seleno)protein [Coraliomargarita sp. J2-16]